VRLVADTVQDERPLNRVPAAKDQSSDKKLSKSGTQEWKVTIIWAQELSSDPY